MTRGTNALFLTLLLFFISALSLKAETTYSVSFGPAGLIQVSQSGSHPAKIQPGWALPLTLSINPWEKLHFTAAAEFRAKYDSDIGGWFSYKGDNGLGLQLKAGWGLPPEDPEQNPVSWGAAAGIGGHYHRINLTDSYFFYLSLETEGLLYFAFESLLPSAADHYLRLSLPVRWNLRRDLDLSVETGLTLSWCYRWQ